MCVVTLDGTSRVYAAPPKGSDARVVQTNEAFATIDGIEVARPVYGPVTGLPAREVGVGLIVSAMVAEAARAQGLARTDLYGPDTGPDAIREAGQVAAVRRLLYRGV